MNEKYKSIINLPHHVSAAHPPMSTINRAAQFAPFAALTGYDGVIAETARLTDSKPELSDDKKAELNVKLNYIKKVGNTVSAEITYFVRDGLKHGGCFITSEQPIKKLDEAELCIVFSDGTRVDIDDITDINILV